MKSLSALGLIALNKELQWKLSKTAISCQEFWNTILNTDVSFIQMT